MIYFQQTIKEREVTNAALHENSSIDTTDQELQIDALKYRRLLNLHANDLMPKPVNLESELKKKSNFLKVFGKKKEKEKKDNGKEETGKEKENKEKSKQKKESPKNEKKNKEAKKDDSDKEKDKAKDKKSKKIKNGEKMKKKVKMENSDSILLNSESDPPSYKNKAKDEEFLNVNEDYDGK